MLLVKIINPGSVSRNEDKIKTKPHKLCPSDLFLKYISSFLMVSVPGV